MILCEYEQLINVERKKFFTVTTPTVVREAGRVLTQFCVKEIQGSCNCRNCMVWKDRYADCLIPLFPKGATRETVYDVLSKRRT